MVISIYPERFTTNKQQTFRCRICVRHGDDLTPTDPKDEFQNRGLLGTLPVKSGRVLAAIVFMEIDGKKKFSLYLEIHYSNANLKRFCDSLQNGLLKSKTISAFLEFREILLHSYRQRQNKFSTNHKLGLNHYLF